MRVESTHIRSVGKSSILTQYLDHRFVESYKATIGADFCTKEMKLDGGDSITMQIWDTAGQERFQSLGPAFFRGADCCVLVFDVNVESTFHNLNRWIKEFELHSGVEDSFPFVVLGNKIDVAGEWAVDRNAIFAWCSQKGFPFYETSAKLRTNVDRAFKCVAEESLSFHMRTSNFNSSELYKDSISLQESPSMMSNCSSSC